MNIATDQAQEVLEQSMLGAWLQDPGAAAAAAQAHGTTARVFTKPDNALIFGAMQALTGRGDPVDEVTVFQMLAGMGAAGRVDLAYLNALFNCVASARNVGHYAMQLAERDKRRRDETALMALARQAGDPLLAADQYETRKAEALAELQAGASTPDMRAHPLALFVEFDASPKAPRWVIPGFIGHGVVIVAGAHGVGKTTCLLPLAMVAAGLHAPGDPLAPREWRHVVYVVEDIEQARRIVAGITSPRGPGLDIEQLRERLHLVEARRLEPAYAVSVGKLYREKFTRTVEGVEVLPLVVIDTKAAVLAVEDENSNGEASGVMAAFKQGFEGLPTWLVGHVSKANLTRADAAGLSLRGGSAFEADANQVLYLVKEADDTRYLVRGKTRFEARWSELVIGSDYTHTTAPDEFGNMEPVTLRWGMAAPPEMTRKEAQEQAQEHMRKSDAAELRDEVRNVVEAAWLGGFPLNREGVKAQVKRNRGEVTDCIECLLSERWLHEVTVPAKERTNPKRAAFLVNLNSAEHEAVRRGAGWPQAKLVVPESWKKPSVPSVPAGEPQEVLEVAHAPPH